MKTDLTTIKIDDPNIAIISDLHFGKSKDNLTKIKISVDFCDWLYDACQAKTIFFLGDWFDNRNSINVHTHTIAFNCLKKLATKFKIYAIVGNHDTYFKTSSDVNSIAHFNSIPNVEVIEELVEIDFNGRKGIFCPWHFNFDEIKDSQYDFMFGHLEANGSILYGTVFNEGTYTLEDLTKISPLVFSGHFHLNKEYDTRSGKVVMVGSPYELDWSDIGNKKGYYELNASTKEYKKIDNPISPLHLKYYWSQLKENTVELKESEIKGNYIQLVVDCDYDYFKVMETCEKMNVFRPIIVIPEFTFSLKEGLMKDMKFEKLELKSDKLYYILKFIDRMELQDTSISKESVKVLARQYFENANNDTSSEEI